MPQYSEPEWGVTQDVTGDPSRFCSVPISPFVLTGVFIRLIQYHFSTPDNISNPALKTMLWTPNNSCNPVPSGSAEDSPSIPPTVVWVDSEYSESVAGTNRRPSVLVKREPVSSQPMSLRSEVLPGKDRRTNTVRGKQMLREIQGKHSLICTGTTGASADVLAQEVFERMSAYAPVIREEFNLGMLNVKGFGEVSSQDLSGGKKAYYAVVSVSWAYAERWCVVSLGPNLRRILLSYPDTE